MVTTDPQQLIALDLLLQERNVTRAAQRMGISQSSMSHRLAELRKHFGDQLLVRQGTHLLLTPRALSMAAPLRHALAQLADAVQAPQTFEPSQARLTFHLLLPDLLMALVPDLVALLSCQAPGVQLVVAQVSADLNERLAQDAPHLALVPSQFVDDHMKCRALGSLRFGVAGRKDHPAFVRRLSVKSWLNHGHVVMSVGNREQNLISQELDRRGLTRKIALVVPMFLSGMLAVAHSDYLMNVPLPVARRAASTMGLTLRPLPFTLPNIPFTLAWHPRFQNDPAHQWLRLKVHQAISKSFTS